MLAINYRTFKNKFEEYCNKVIDSSEGLIINCKDKKNIVVMPLDQCAKMMKEIKNAQYISKLEKAFKQIEEGKYYEHELIEADENEEDVE